MPAIVKRNSESVYKLHSGGWARIPFYNNLMLHISSRINDFKDKGLFTLRDICDPVFWASLGSNHMKRIAGMCFRTMVGEGRFPLKSRRYKRSPTKYYEFSK